MSDTREDSINSAVRNAKPVRKSAPLERSDLLMMSDLQGKAPPARSWCVEGMIPDHNVTSLYGDGGTGKSLLALQLATACVMGTDWLGIPVSRRKVLYISCEDDRAEIHRRQHAINRAEQFEMADFEDRYAVVDRSGEDSLWMTFPPKSGRGTLSAFASNMRSVALAMGAQLVVIDTAADTFGGNEIVRAEVRQFLTSLKRLAIDIDGAVLLLAHPSVAGLREKSGYSGSTAWRGSVRSLLVFEFEEGEDADPNRRVLKRLKANYASSGTTLSVTYVDGVFHQLSPPVEQPTALDEVTDDRLFLDKLRGLLDRGLCPSASKNRPEFAPQLMKQTFAKELRNVTVGRLQAAMRRLIEAGRIVQKQHRKGSRPLCPEDYDITKWGQG